MTLRRLPGWRARLDAALDEIRHVPFDWRAQHDCGPGLVGRAAVAMCGESADAIVELYRGRYGSARGALKLMREEGFADLADMAASHLPECHPAMARVGDCAAFSVDTPFGYALGVVGGERVFVLRDEGLATLPLLGATRAFRIG